jgi:hypothetical protein
MWPADVGDLAQDWKTVEKVGPAFLFDLDGTLVDSVYAPPGRSRCPVCAVTAI